MVGDGEARAPEHGLSAGPVRNPPVRRVGRVAVLDEVEHRIAGLLEVRRLAEVVIRRRTADVRRAPQHGLKHERLTDSVFVQDVEREQRMPQVVQDAHEEHQIESLLERGQVVDGHLAQIDVEPGNLRGQPGLREVPRVAVDAEHAVGAAPLHLERVEACVAAYVQHRAAAQVCRDGMGEPPPLHGWVIAQKVGRGRLDPVEVQVVEPVTELAHALLDVLRSRLRKAHTLLTIVLSGSIPPPVASCTYCSSSIARCTAVCACRTRSFARRPRAARASSGSSRR